MAISQELQAQADEIRRNKSLVKSLQAERDLWKSEAISMRSTIDDLAGKNKMSDEDREELRRQVAELDELNDELEGAAQANVQPELPAQPGEIPPAVPAEEIPTDPDAPRPDPLPGTARGDGAPLMPNMAFDPDPTGHRSAGTDGQPNQPAAIETAGGFVVSGGGTTQRAPDSAPESPSSSMVTDEPAPEPAGIPAYQQDGIPPVGYPTADEAAAAQAKYDAEQAAKAEQDKADAAAKVQPDFPEEKAANPS